MKIANYGLSLLIIFVTNTALAETDTTGFYLGGTLGMVSGKESSAEIDLNETGNALGVLLGYHITRNFGIEQTILSGYHNQYVSQSTSIGVKGTVFLNEKISVYGKLGYAVAFVINEDDNDWGWDNQSGRGAALGAGVNFALAQKTYLRAAYEFLRIKLQDSDNNYADTNYGLHSYTLSLYYQF